MKLKDYFSKLKEQGKINNEAYDKFLESVADGELPDGIFQTLENTFLTTDRAAVDPRVNQRLRFEHLNPINRDIQKILEILDKHDKYTSSEIAKLVKPIGEGDNKKEVPDTYKQLEALTNSLPKLFDKLKVAPNDEETKKALADKDKTLQELTQKFTDLENAKAGQIKQIEKEWTTKFDDYILNSELEKMANSYTFADVYSETRGALTKAMLAELKASNHLALATKETGERFIEVNELKEGRLQPKFEGNTPVTINSLLDTKFKPFLKVNNADNGNEHQQQQNGSQSNNPKTFTVNQGQQTQRRGAQVDVSM